MDVDPYFNPFALHIRAGRLYRANLIRLVMAGLVPGGVASALTIALRRVGTRLPLPSAKDLANLGLSVHSLTAWGEMIGLIFAVYAVESLVVVVYAAGVQRAAIAALDQPGPMRPALLVPGPGRLLRYLLYWAIVACLLPLIGIGLVTVAILVPPLGMLLVTLGYGAQTALVAYLFVTWIYTPALMAQRRLGFPRAFGTSGDIVGAVGWWPTFACVLVLWLPSLVCVYMLLLIAVLGWPGDIVAQLVLFAVVVPYASCYVALMYVRAAVAKPAVWEAEEVDDAASSTLLPVFLRRGRHA